MKDLHELSINESTKYMHLSRRSFLKGALAVGGALALAGCGDKVTDPATSVTNTTTAATTATATTATTAATTAATAPEIGEIKNLVTAPSHIVPIYENCSGCKICMFECSIFHYGVANLADSNIVVHIHDLHRGTVDIPILCQHCNDHPCLKACPEKVQAITINEVSGALVFDHEKCTLCGKCIEACDADRTGCLHFDITGEKVVGACDFCDCNPSCVVACPEDCLRLAVKAANADGRYWAVKSSQLAEGVYNTIFGDYYEHLKK